MSTQQPKRKSRAILLLEEPILIVFPPLLALPFAATFAAGAIAGVSEILTFYPLGE